MHPMKFGFADWFFHMPIATSCLCRQIKLQPKQRWIEGLWCSSISRYTFGIKSLLPDFRVMLNPVVRIMTFRKNSNSLYLYNVQSPCDSTPILTFSDILSLVTQNYARDQPSSNDEMPKIISRLRSGTGPRYMRAVSNSGCMSCDLAKITAASLGSGTSR